MVGTRKAGACGLGYLLWADSRSARCAEVVSGISVFWGLRAWAAGREWQPCGCGTARCFDSESPLQAIKTAMAKQQRVRYNIEHKPRERQDHLSSRRPANQGEGNPSNRSIPTGAGV